MWKIYKPFMYINIRRIRPRYPQSLVFKYTNINWRKLFEPYEPRRFCPAITFHLESRLLLPIIMAFSSTQQHGTTRAWMLLLENSHTVQPLLFTVKRACPEWLWSRTTTKIIRFILILCLVVPTYTYTVWLYVLEVNMGLLVLVWVSISCW